MSYKCAIVCGAMSYFFMGGMPLQAMEINEKKKTEVLVSEDDTDSLNDLVLEWASVELGKNEGDGVDATSSFCGSTKTGLPYKIAECLSCVCHGSFTDIYGNTLLHWGAEKDWLDVVGYFLPFIDCDLKNKKGETALFIAAKKGGLEIVKLLVKHGAIRDKKTGLLDDEIGATIDKETIEVAANSDIQRYLSTDKKNSNESSLSSSETGSEIVDQNVDDIKGGMKEENTAPAKLLVEIGASIDKKSSEKIGIDSDYWEESSDISVGLASRFEPQELEGHIVAILKEVKDQSFCDSHGNTLLHWGARWSWGRSPGHVSTLLPFINCNLRNKKGHTALLMVAKRNALYELKCLVRAGAIIDKEVIQIIGDKTKYPECSNILFYLLTHKDIIHHVNDLVIHQDIDALYLARLVKIIEKEISTKKMLEELTAEISQGMGNINGVTERGHTVLEVAIKKQNVAAFKLLVENGADVNRANYKGETPLHMATIKGLPEMAKNLINYHADLEAHNKDGVTPFQLALQNRLFKMALSLAEQGALVNAKDLVNVKWKDQLDVQKALVRISDIYRTVAGDLAFGEFSKKHLGVKEVNGTINVVQTLLPLYQKKSIKTDCFVKQLIVFCKKNKKSLVLDNKFKIIKE